jgi:hypothetical protein
MLQEFGSDAGRCVRGGASGPRATLPGMPAGRSLTAAPGGCVYASAVVGSSVPVSRVTRVTGKPPRRACSRTAFSSGAT